MIIGKTLQSIEALHGHGLCGGFLIPKGRNVQIARVAFTDGTECIVCISPERDWEPHGRQILHVSESSPAYRSS